MGYVMKAILILCSILSISSLPADKVHKLKKRVEWHESKMDELYVDLQMLRERIDALEEKIDGTHEYNASSTAEQAERLATTTDCDQP